MVVDFCLFWMKEGGDSWELIGFLFLRVMDGIAKNDSICIRPRPAALGRPKVNGEQVNKKIEATEAVLENYNGFIFGLFLWVEEEGCSSNEKEQKK